MRASEDDGDRDVLKPLWEYNEDDVVMDLSLNEIKLSKREEIVDEVKSKKLTKKKQRSRPKQQKMA